MQWSDWYSTVLSTKAAYVLTHDIICLALGICGFVDDEDYTCSLGQSDAFNALNLITGIAFLSGVIISFLFMFYLCFKNNQQIRRVIQGIIIGFIAGSLIFITADVIYALYVASYVLPNVAEWERNKTLCGEPVFRSSFGIIVTYFLLVFIITVAGAVVLARFIFKHFKRSLNSSNINAA